MNSNSSPSARLLAYGTLACGATALISGNAEAATIVQVNASSFDTGNPVFGIFAATDYSMPAGEGRGKGYLVAGGTGFSLTTGDAFRRGSDTSTPASAGSAGFEQTFFNGESAINGALMNSSDNWFYAISAEDPTQRMWLQLHFGSSGIADFAIVKAVIPDVVGELPSASHAAAAVPETSSLALLSLGAAGLLKRRRRAA